MKKVLFINASLSSGGSERVMTQLANEFVKREISVSMILIRKKERTYKVNHNIELIELNYNNKNKYMMLIERLIKLRKEIKRINPDTIISFMTDINIFTLISSIGLSNKVIISERNHPVFIGDGKTKKPMLTRIMTEICYSWSDTIVFQTEQAKSFMRKSFQKKGKVICNPVWINNISVESEPKKEIVAIGRLVEQKNFPMLIRVFANISKKYEDFKLKIYGKGKLELELKAMVEKLGIKDKVEFKGFVKDIPNEIRRAYLYVSTSNFEGISNAMLEALAMGIPAVCTNCPVGGAELVIENGINGYLVDVGNEKELEENIEKVLSDNILRKKLSLEAVKVREKLALENICDEWIKLL